MEYTEFSVEQQENAVRGKIAAWESDHYNHSINLAAGKAAGDKATVEVSERAMATLEKSIEAGRAELEALRSSAEQ